MLPVKNESRDKCLDFISNSIDYNQIKIPYLRLAFITEKNNDQTRRVQLVLVVRVIDHELYIL